MGTPPGSLTHDILPENRVFCEHNLAWVNGSFEALFQIPTLASPNT